MKVRPARPEDLLEIIRIERLCFSRDTAFWPEILAHLISQSKVLIACDHSDRTIGFVVGDVRGEIGAIFTLDVHPRFRRRGVGRTLLGSMEQQLCTRGARKIRLEAALDSLPALILYWMAGYKERQIVRDYYGPGRDAIRMWKHLSQQERLPL